MSVQLFRADSSVRFRTPSKGIARVSDVHQGLPGTDYYTKDPTLTLYFTRKRRRGRLNSISTQCFRLIYLLFSLLRKINVFVHHRLDYNAACSNIKI